MTDNKNDLIEKELDIKIYNLKEVAEILKLSNRTLLSYIKNGKLHAVKVGREWRVSKEELQRFLKEGK